MSESTSQADEVIAALKAFINRIDQMLELISEKSSITNIEKKDLQALLRDLKNDITDALKRRTVKETRSPQNIYESNFFEPAVRNGHAFLKIKINSHPINSNWFHSLCKVRIDFSEPLAHLLKIREDMEKMGPI